MEFLGEFFKSESFMPHGHCYLWRSDILWLNAGSDALIAVAYFVIPGFLIYFVKRRKDMQFNWIFVMFALFIMACGTSHIAEIWTIWKPDYAIQGTIKLFTACVSIATAGALWPLMPRALAWANPEKLEERMRDMDERALVDDVLKRNEERFRRVIEAAPNGLLMVDRNGKVVLCNTEFESLFGYRREEIVGREMEFLVPERFRPNHASHRRGFFQSPTTRQMGVGRDLYGLRKDGTEFPVEIGLNPMVTDEGAFVLASIVDITKRKVLEDRLRESAARLQQKSQEMEQFVYTVSHDLKSPLVTSSGFLGLLKEDLAAQRYDHLEDSMMRLARANDRMNQLINDLLQLSRVGRIKLEVETVDVRALVNSVIENLSSQIQEKAVAMRIEGLFPPIRGDYKRIYQVFENLIINALKYGAANSNPTLTIGTDAPGTESENEIRFYVRDNGIGIAKEYHKKIFGLFQRLENDGRGTGVGLAIVSRVMQLHGGRAWVESEPGKGASFWLAFPKNFVVKGEGENE